MLPFPNARTWRLLGLTLLTFFSACAAPPSTPDLGVEAPEGYQLELYTTGLDGPTQMIIGPDDRIWLAQLAGPEGEGVGQVIALNYDDPVRREILLEGLFKPTGIAVLEDALWIAAGRDLLRASLNVEGKPETPVTIREELPFNGRSNGTLTVTPDGNLMYETSGRRRGNSATEGSASLWELNPKAPSESRLFATGMKNAYAHTYDEEGRLWATDVGDDPVDGSPPPDELNLVAPDANYGWPACFGQQEAARNYGGTEATCAETQPAVAVFPPRSTPTSVVASPWEEDVLLVALWGPTDPSVARVHIVEREGVVIADEVSPFLTGLAHPQSLLVLDDGSLLVSDFDSGTLYRLRQQ